MKNEDIMSMKKLAVAFSAMVGLGGCATANYSTLSEHPGTYDSTRTPIYGQPVECTIRTNERGVTYGGTVVYDQGTASRTCVSSPRSSVRGQSGINDDLQRTNRTINQVGQGINSINRVLNSLERLGR